MAQARPAKAPKVSKAAEKALIYQQAEKYYLHMKKKPPVEARKKHSTKKPKMSTINPDTKESDPTKKGKKLINNSAAIVKNFSQSFMKPNGAAELQEVDQLIRQVNLYSDSGLNREFEDHHPRTKAKVKPESQRYLQSSNERRQDEDQLNRSGAAGVDEMDDGKEF